MRALRFLLRKEFLQIVRDHTLLGMILMMPLIQLVILANAVTFEVRSAALHIVDQDHSTMSRALIDRMFASGRFTPAGTSQSAGAAGDAMLRGQADLIMIVPPDFENDLVRERRAPVQIIIDAEDGAAAAVTQSYVTRVLADFATELNAELVPSIAAPGSSARHAAAPGKVAVDVQRRGWYNPDLDYRDYMVPGILVVLVTMIGTLLTAMNIVREKESGTLDQLNVTPIARSTFIAAKLIPLWTFALLDLSLGLAFAHFVLGVPVRGSLLLVFFAAAIYLVVALGIGLWISTIVETQQQAMFVTFALLMVYLLMSGLFTPVRGMPDWAQWLTHINPLAQFVHLMRAVLLKGAGPVDVARQLAILAVMGPIVLTLAVRRYRKRGA